MALCLTDDSAKPSELLRAALTAAAAHVSTPVDAIGAGRIGVVTHQLFARQAVDGLLPLATLDERSTAKCLRVIRKQSAPVETESDDDGVVKKLQAL